ncbi:MAG: hypothetical protein RLZZ308_407 [Candidatus Parcubacteria bacterium]|jgi:hypothetical protein
MTISEIEKTLHELSLRHPDLDRGMLVTLLDSAGWEQKYKDEALMLFMSFHTLASPSLTSSYPLTPSQVTPSHSLDIDTNNIASSALSSELQMSVVGDTENKETILVTGAKSAFPESVPSSSSYAEQVDTSKADNPQDSQVTTPSTKEEQITFYLPDGKEEELPVTSNEDISFTREVSDYHQSDHVTSDEKKVEPVESTINTQAQVSVGEGFDDHNNQEKNKEAQIESHDSTLSSSSFVQEKEEESLIPDVDHSIIKTEQGAIPGNLPLIPFEDSEHVWSFDKYKHAFHEESSDTAVSISQGEQTNNIQQIQPIPVIDTPFSVTKERSGGTPHRIDSEENSSAELDFEKTPITRSDQSLVVLASFMLLAIILILGYMYSNGRL